MTDNAIAVVVLAAGRGERMKSKRSKVLHEIGGRAMVAHVLETATALAPSRIALVIGEHTAEVGAFAKRIDSRVEIAVQAPPQGTGHAVAQALPALEGFSGAVLVLYADTPLVRPEKLRALCGKITDGASVAVLGFSPEDPAVYGRLKLDDKGALAAIVEAKDASEAELAITFCNSGVMAVDAEFLRRRLPAVQNKNAKGEYYLTDIVALARADGLACAVAEAETEEVIGVNTRSDLADVEFAFQQRMRARAMNEGATLVDPSTVYFSHDTVIGEDVTVGPFVVFGPGVVIEDNAEIAPFTHVVGAKIAAAAAVGPFARLRPGAHIMEDAKVGNFVEIKNAQLGPGSKASHLSYIGDAQIGAAANIGAGVITCNYDGAAKHQTVIGKDAFVGSNSALVAPVAIGDGAYVGSGSVITKDVAAGDLAVARGRQTAIKGWAARFRKTEKGKS